jgi:hypothetical protein
MISQAITNVLLRAPRADAPVVSLYLNLDPSHSPVVLRDLQIRVASVLDATQREIQDPAWEKLFEAEKVHLQRFAADYEPRGKGVAIFSSLPQELWLVVPSEMPFSDSCSYSPTPRIGPLLDVHDESEPYAVLLLDAQHADFYIVAFGTAQKVADAFDYLPLKNARNQWGRWVVEEQQAKHRQEQRERHVEHVAEALDDLLEEWNVRRLIVGADPRAYASLSDRLSDRARTLTIQRVQGLRAGTGGAQIVQTTAAVAQQLESEADSRLVGSLIERASKGDAAVLGAERTIESFLDHRLHRLVTAEGVQIAGGYCPACSYLSTLKTERCPRCNSAMILQDDIIERLKELAFGAGAVVEQVNGEAAAGLGKYEGVGALLKYNG